MESTRAQTVAFGAALGQILDQRGWSQARLGAELAHHLDESPIAQATVSNWVQGHNRPTPERVFAMEAALDLAPGSLSRLLGWLPVDAVEVVGVEAAIDADPRLSPMARRVLKASYAAAVSGPSPVAPSARAS